METLKEHNGKSFFIIEMETCRVLPCVFNYEEKTVGHPKTTYVTKRITFKAKGKRNELVIPYYKKFKLKINPNFTKEKLSKYFYELETKGSTNCIDGVENMRDNTYIVAFDDEVKAKKFLKEVVVACQIERRLMAAEVHLNKYNKVISEISLFEKIKETL